MKTKKYFHVSFLVSSDGCEGFPPDNFMVKELLFCNLEYSSLQIVDERDGIAVAERRGHTKKEQQPIKAKPQIVAEKANLKILQAVNYQNQNQQAESPISKSVLDEY